MTDFQAAWEGAAAGRREERVQDENGGVVGVPATTEQGGDTNTTEQIPGQLSAVQAVDPRDGTLIFDLEAEPTDRLADLVLEYRRREADQTTWRKTVEAEIRHRLEAEGRRMAVVGRYELQVDTGNRRDWDPDDLQLVCTELIDQGILTVGEVTGLIKRTVTVDGTVARRLLGRLTGDPLAQVEACFTWKKGAPKLTISLVPNLADALPQGASDGT